MIDTIVLAGGSSRRFGTNKLQADMLGEPLIHHTIKTFYDISQQVIVVTGEYSLEPNSLSDPNSKINIVTNPNHRLGMFTSVQRGIQETNNSVFIIPGDMPLVNPKTLQIIAESTGEIRVPVYGNRRGHPIFIHRHLHDVLLQEPLDSNLKAFRDRYAVNYIEVDDPGILIDIDTEQDLSNHQPERTESHED